MKILIAPLNWGLGHATRCIPIIRNLLSEGHTVVIGGDGNSFLLLQKHFPNLEVIPLPHLNIHYSAGSHQTATLLWQLPKFIRFYWADHYFLKRLLQTEKFDRIISDNRFGLWNKHTECIYITHQLMIKLPTKWRFLEPFMRKVHKSIICRYNYCWIPDTDVHGGLSGELSHKYPLPPNVKFIGTLSRFSKQKFDSVQNENRQNGNISALTNLDNEKFQAVALLSGLEPQRTLFEQSIIQKYRNTNQKLLIVQGKTANIQTATSIEQKDLTRIGDTIILVPQLDDETLKQVLIATEKIIARSGYSTIMDLDALGLLHKAELTPTPGQTEQEYLAEWLKKNNKILNSAPTDG